MRYTIEKFNVCMGVLYCLMWYFIVLYEKFFGNIGITWMEILFMPTFISVLPFLLGISCFKKEK